MDRERKRKRAEKAEARKGDDKMKNKGKEPAEEVSAAAEASPSPTEEEVEEFFAILRRMRVAVKYFEKEAFDNTKSGTKEPQSSAAAEADVGGGKVKGGLELDLNAVPEAESSLV